MNEFKSPQQQVFDAIYKISENLGYRTFDYLPAKDAGYPFVFLGEQFDQDRNLKDVVIGTVEQTVHIYEKQRNRRSLTDIMDKLKSEARKLKHTENFDISSVGINARTIPDNSSTQPLWHGIIELTIKFN